MKFKCGVIGLGRIGCGFDDDISRKTINTHAGAYSIDKSANLSALCDIDERKLSKYGTKYKVSGLYTDYRKMLENESLDCISICTLADSHLEIVKEAAENNVRGIFLEKPMSTNLNDALSIIEICRERNIKLQIDFQRRFDPFYVHLKELLCGKLCKIQHCVIHYGGGIANTGSHIFDLLRFFFGNIVSVQGTHSKNFSPNPSDPNVDGSILCDNNITCYFHALDVSNYGLLELDIFSTHERLRIDLVRPYAEHFKITESNELAYKRLISVPIIKHDSEDAIVLGLKDLLHSIQNNTEPKSGGRNGYHSLEAVIGILKSADSDGRRISLPLTIDSYKISSK